MLANTLFPLSHSSPGLSPLSPPPTLNSLCGLGDQRALQTTSWSLDTLSLQRNQLRGKYCIVQLPTPSPKWFPSPHSHTNSAVPALQHGNGGGGLPCHWSSKYATKDSGHADTYWKLPAKQRIRPPCLELESTAGLLGAANPWGAAQSPLAAGEGSLLKMGREGAGHPSVLPRSLL